VGGRSGECTDFYLFQYPDLEFSKIRVHITIDSEIKNIITFPKLIQSGPPLNPLERVDLRLVIIVVAFHIRSMELLCRFIVVEMKYIVVDVFKVILISTYLMVSPCGDPRPEDSS
jgi:hypothetical protein